MGTFIAYGSRPADGSGQILLYKSADGFEWEFVSVLAEKKKTLWKDVGVSGLFSN